MCRYNFSWGGGEGWQRHNGEGLWNRSFVYFSQSHFGGKRGKGFLLPDHGYTIVGIKTYCLQVKNKVTN